MQLYINTYGAYVHIKDEMFEVRLKDDETQTIKKHHFAASKVSGIVLTTGAALSTDAIRLAIINNVDIIVTEKDGKPLGRVWHSKLGSTTKIRKCQLEASMNETGVKYTKEWLLQKMNNQREFILSLKKHRPNKADFLDDKIKRMEALALSVSSLESGKVSDIADTLRGLEGTSGRLYFETLSKMLVGEYQFSGRSSRPAKDPFNAFLNYAFGILYSKVEKALIIAGLDPYLGFLHRDDYNQLSFVYDFIEPYRIYAETVVFRLFSGKKVNKSHTDLITNGVSLNSEGKALLVAAFNKYFDEEGIRYKGKNQTRSNTIQYDAHSFANTLIQ
ncbi:CRISPR-associated endonuclease Cas1 [Litoribacter populi]|uniref:CRISPR-associated endonuclease Cas1 n=1 Tax=Litoribacter populi TaxID=2598460 RepID=UPI00117E0D54|nr:CRISPR-associated endonuclease Cas1 [Litoribacter populi]